ISTLGNDEYLEGYAIKVAREWGIGEETKDNGVLLLIAKDDRQLRIEVGRGLEGDLTDAEAGRIVRNTLAPAFRAGNYVAGIEAAVRNVTAQVEDTPELDTSAGQPDSSNSTSFLADVFTWVFFSLIWIFPWLGSLFARTKSWWAGGVVGLLAGLLVAFVFGWAIWALGLALVTSLLGLFLDKAVSENYTERKKHGEDPSWWAGGTIFPGGGSSSGTWGRGGGGGFGGGGFSGGGSSGSW
ncbi:hypothetical protein B7Z17_03795, partial [Candidatus Saccharibacteria bacterium 32-49-10]